MTKEDDVFKNPFIKEYLFNIQVNQQISMSEFLFTKKAFLLFFISAILLIINNGNAIYVKYISIGFFLLLIYLFKNSRILKKEKYFVKKDNDSGKGQEMFIHMFLNKIIKNALKKSYLIIALLFSFSNYGYCSFESNINDSTDTQKENNKMYMEENEKMVERSKLKMVNYMIQEKKISHLLQITEQTLTESNLEINKSKIAIEKAKNEIEQ